MSSIIEVLLAAVLMQGGTDAARSCIKDSTCVGAWCHSWNILVHFITSVSHLSPVQICVQGDDHLAHRFCMGLWAVRYSPSSYLLSVKL